MVSGEVVRVKLWSPDGTITYSDEASLIGTRYENELGDILAGDPNAEKGKLNDEGGSGENIDVLSAYVPVRIDGSREPVGVFELYTNFDEVTADAMATVKPVAIALSLALLLLYASLFPILRQVTGALETRTRRLQQQSDELEQSIAERKQALPACARRMRGTAPSSRSCRSSAMSAHSTRPGSRPTSAPSSRTCSATRRRNGLPRPGSSGRSSTPMTPSASAASTASAMGTPRRSPPSTGCERRTAATSGSRIRSASSTTGTGSPMLAQGFLIDITARKSSELALTESESRFRGLVANIPGTVFRCDIDSDWTMEFLSDGIEELVGYPSTDFIDNRVRSFGSVVHPDDRARLEADVASSVADRTRLHDRLPGHPPRWNACAT